MKEDLSLLPGPRCTAITGFSLHDYACVPAHDLLGRVIRSARRWRRRRAWRAVPGSGNRQPPQRPTSHPCGALCPRPSRTISAATANQHGLALFAKCASDPLTCRKCGGRLRIIALTRGQQVLGLQIDYDCPTGELSRYRLFLARLRKELPPGTLHSVTALLDWFRPGTDIGRMLANVSEFVPQFYDVGERGEGTGPGIAKLIDPARWAPLFNSRKVPYRVGISAFGRISLFHNGKPCYFRDIAPIDVLGRSGLQKLKDELTPAGSAWKQKEGAIN